MLQESRYKNGKTQVSYRHNFLSKKRETIIFLHGFPDGPSVWDGIGELLDKEFNLIIPYLPGVHSDCEIEDRLSERFFLSLLLLLEKELGPSSPVHLVGHDVGGVLADQLSFILGSRCQSVTFISTMGLNLYSQNLKIDQIIKSWYVPLFSTKIGQRVMGRSNRYSKLLLKKIDSTTPDHQIPNRLGSIKFYQEFTKRLYRKSDSGRINNTKSLFLFSTNDPFVQIPSKDLINKLYPNSTVRVLKGGHWEFCHRSEYFCRLIREGIKGEREEEYEYLQI